MTMNFIKIVFGFVRVGISEVWICEGLLYYDVVGLQGYPDFRCSFVDPEICTCSSSTKLTRSHNASIIFRRDVKMLENN